MRLPLLVAGQPHNDCVKVRIPAGTWKLLVEDLVDSVISTPMEFTTTEPTLLQLQFAHLGTEKRLTVYVEN